MRVAIGGLWHETNTFSPSRTTVDDFRRFQLSEGEAVVRRNCDVANEIGGFIDAGQKSGFTLIPLLFAGALPSGKVTSEAFDFLRTRMQQALRAALPLDGVLLCLHGAMVAEGVDDVEAELLADVRTITGAKCPIVATVDLHANVSSEFVELPDVVIGYDTYPHVDIYERGCEAAKILKLLLNGTKVRHSFRKLPLLTAPQSQCTSHEPMLSVMNAAHDWEAEPGVLSVTVTSGYPYADVSRIGMSVIAYSTLGDDLANRCCEQLAALIWARRDDFTVQNASPHDAVRDAIAASEGPVILVDVADNIGGGSPGDGTVLLRELIVQGATGAVVTLADPESASKVVAAGSGEVEIRAGGKSDAFHGDPLSLRGVVRLISDGVYTHRGTYMTGLRVEMGRTAVITCGGIEIVLMERKAMPFDAEQLRCLGIEPANKKIIVVKSASAWQAAYGDIAKQAIYVDTPGLCSSNLSFFAYRHRPHPVYPLESAANYEN